MGLFSRAHGAKEIDAQEPRRSPSSYDPSERHRHYGCHRRPPKNVSIQDFAHPRPVNGSRKPPHSPDPRTSYQSRDQKTIQVFHRDARDLYEEAFHEVAPNTATKYPCTKEELKASGGANRRTAVNAFNLKNKSKWFAHPNKGRFIDVRDAAREVFDYNDPKRTPSAAEDEAIDRLVTAFENAGQEPWGPDIAIKAFCDLDKVFFCGRLKGHVCLTWRSDRSFEKDCFGNTFHLGGGKCVIQLNAYCIFFTPRDGSSFVQMFATLLHEMCHAYQSIRALEHGPKGWMVGRADIHGKNFGTMIHAVNRRAWELLGFEGDPTLYLRHDYAYGDGPGPATKHPIPAPKQPPPQKASPRNPSRPAAPHKRRQELYNDAFKDVTLDTGTDYTCMQSDLDATGGVARRAFPNDYHKDRTASRKKWFPRQNQGPFIAPRQACLDIFEHNDLRRKPGTLEREAIDRLFEAIAMGRHSFWGPDVIIKAFCDLDIFFFRGRLRGHVCVRWLPNWSARGEATWGTTVFLGEGKCAIRINADAILLHHSRPFECMFATMLHEMCHADAHTQVQEHEMLKCGSHGKNFGTKYYAVEKRAQKLFGLSLTGYRGEKYPRHRYEKGEGFP